MMMLKKVHIIYLLFICSLFYLSGTGCIKEYSYEGGPEQDTTQISDTLMPVKNILPSCTICNNLTTLPFSSWTFKNGSSVQCGTITAARINVERDALTFFGPSSCSKDTGLILTVYFANQPLNRDRFNLPADKAEFEYYDNIAPSYILKSWLPHTFLLTIDSYVHQTGLTTGTFRGYAFTEKGDSSMIENGRFNIKIP